jgi:hypothetical protein
MGFILVVAELLIIVVCLRIRVQYSLSLHWYQVTLLYMNFYAVRLAYAPPNSCIASSITPRCKAANDSIEKYEGVYSTY